MSNSFSLSPYNQDVVDMVTISVQTCLILEHTQEFEKNDFVEKLVKILPMLYFKYVMIEYQDKELDGYLQTFVSEEDYNLVVSSVSELLGNDDSYLEVFMEDMRYSDTPIASSISENLGDIYQELKDLAGNFQTGDENVMTDAVYAALLSFKDNWGQKLLNCLRALHFIYVSPSETE